MALESTLRSYKDDTKRSTNETGRKILKIREKKVIEMESRKTIRESQCKPKSLRISINLTTYRKTDQDKKMKPIN